MKNILFTALTIIMLVIGGLSINRCSNAPQNSSIAKIDTILEIRHDTLLRIDSVLKYKIRRIESIPDTEIVKVFDTVFADTGHSDTVKTTVYAERECLKCIDSLQACKAVVHVDSQAIDSSSKIAKEKEPTDWQTLGLIGAGGVILGIILTR